MDFRGPGHHLPSKMRQHKHLQKNRFLLLRIWKAFYAGLSMDAPRGIHQTLFFTVKYFNIRSHDFLEAGRSVQLLFRKPFCDYHALLVQRFEYQIFTPPNHKWYSHHTPPTSTKFVKRSLQSGDHRKQEIQGQDSSNFHDIKTLTR